MTETAWRIRDKAVVEERDAAIWPPQRLRIFRGEDRIFVARVSVLASFVHDAATAVGVEYDSEEGGGAVDVALARYGMRRLEEGLRLGVFPTEPTVDVVQLQVEEADRPLFTELLREKSCRWQLEDEGELLCTAATANDETVLMTMGRRRVAPTTRPTCRACELPDSDVLCSHLSHPEVAGFGALGAPLERHVAGALCELGRDEVLQPNGCRSGGHSCFERIVEEETTVPALQSEMALPEAFDYLDAVWRLHFGRDRRLLNMPTAADVAGLAQSAESRSELETRLSDLADVLARLSVPDDLIPSQASPEERKGSLNRLTTVLRTLLHSDSWDRTESAVNALRAVNRVRVAAQHGAASAGLPSAFADLRLPYPPPSAAAAWDQIRARTIEALATIREEIRGLTT